MKKLFVLILIIGFLLSGISVYLPIHAEDRTVFINEFLPDGLGSDSGKEWVELYNLSDQDINLKDWKISTKTSTSSPRNTTLSEVIIKKHNFFIVTEFADLPEGLENVDHLNVTAGKLNMYNSNAEIYLTDNLANKVDDLFYTTTQEAKSLERRGPVNSDYCNLLQIPADNSIGVDNYSKDTSCWPINLPPTPEPELTINEIRFSSDNQNFANSISFEAPAQLYFKYSLSNESFVPDVIEYSLDDGTLITNPYIFTDYNNRKVKLKLTFEGKEIEKWSDPILITPKIEQPGTGEDPETPTDPGSGDTDNSDQGSQSNILISEIYPSPNKNLNETEWLEVYNQDISTVDLTGMYLKERAGDGLSSTKTMLPATTLESGSYIIIPENSLKLSLNNSGDVIYLLDVNDTIVDIFCYTNTETSNSVSRKFINESYLKTYNSDENLNFVPITTIPTPGAINKFPQPEILTINDIKKSQPGEFVKTIGSVNSQLGLIDDNVFYLQDDTAGIKISLDFEQDNYDNLGILIARSIEITGYLKFTSASEPYIEVRSPEDINIISDHEVDIFDLNNNNDDSSVDNFTNQLGMLSHFSGQLYKNYGTTFYLQADDKIIKVKILSSSGITSPSKMVGDIIEATGVLIKDGDYFTIIPRYSVDLKIFSDEEISKSSNTTPKKTNPSTLAQTKILGTETQTQNLISESSNSTNAGDKLYKQESSTDNESKIYPWPIYLTSSSIALLELIKMLGKVSKLLK